MDCVLRIRSDFREAKKLKRKEYRLQKKQLRKDYKKRLDEAYGVRLYERGVAVPRRTVLEEIGNAITHGLGTVFAIVAFILMMIKGSGGIEYLSSSICFVGMFTMFLVSCLYHALPYGRGVKRLFRRFDYSSIYLLIGSTFAPLLLCYIGGVYGIAFAIAQWAIIALGVTLTLIKGPEKVKKFNIPMYVILGWSALLFLPKMIGGDLDLFYWILGGGIAYTLGIVPFAINKKSSHFLWHIFVLAGAVLQWVGIYLYVIGG